jgi:hypothetical protein
MSLLQGIREEIERLREKGDVPSSIGLFAAYPIYVRGIMDETDDTTEQDTILSLLNRAHFEAVETLGKAAIKHGLNPQPIFRSGDICARLHQKHDYRLPLAPDRTSNTWPDCLGIEPDCIDDAEREVLRQGDGMLRHLSLLYPASTTDNAASAAGAFLNKLAQEESSIQAVTERLQALLERPEIKAKLAEAAQGAELTTDVAGATGILSGRLLAACYILAGECGVDPENFTAAELVKFALARRKRLAEKLFAGALAPAVAEGHQPTDKQPAAVLGPLASAKQLADALKLNEDRVEGRLRRYRKEYPDCYVETEGQRKNEPRYLYRTADVLPELQKLSPSSAPAPDERRTECQADA